jgi:hypothetical protein
MDISTDKVLEYVVAVLMRRNGYRVGCPGGLLTGRGTKHQIDAIGVYPFPAPFTFPVRLICEAKCWSPGGRNTKVPVEVVRNLQAIVTDLQQTLPREKKLVLREEREESVSCNYHGALFSTIPFSGRTVQFANSYALDLVPLDDGILGGNPVESLKFLRDTLIYCIQSGSPAFSAKCVYSEETIGKLGRAKKHEDLPVDGAERRALLDLVEFVLVSCSDQALCRKVPSAIKDLRNLLFANRLASVDGHVVALNIPDDDFQALRRATTRRYYARAIHRPDEGGVPDPFYPPPEDSLPGEDSPRGNAPYDRVFLESVGTEGFPGKLRGGEDEGVRDDGRGNFVRVMFFMTGENPEGKPIKVKAKATVSKDLHAQLTVVSRPRKVVIPVDFGCFFYGLLA